MTRGQAGTDLKCSPNLISFKKTVQWCRSTTSGKTESHLRLPLFTAVVSLSLGVTELYPLAPRLPAGSFVSSGGIADMHGMKAIFAYGQSEGTVVESQAHTHERRWCLVVVTGFHMRARAARHNNNHHHAATAQVATRGRLCLCRFSPPHDYNLPPPPPSPCTSQARHERKYALTPALSLARPKLVHSTLDWHLHNNLTLRVAPSQVGTSLLRSFAIHPSNRQHGGNLHQAHGERRWHPQAQFTRESRVCQRVRGRCWQDPDSHRHNHSSRVGRGGN